jgi:nucleotide-binding universal stress UspA family protein
MRHASDAGGESQVSVGLPSTAGYKDVMVHLDGTSEDEIRIVHAEGLATLFSAHLTGLYTNKLPDIGDYPSPVGAMAYIELERKLREDGEVAKARLAERFARIAPPSDLRKIEAMPGELRRDVVTEARWADLFVASLARGAGLGRWTSLIEAVLFEGGRGVLLIPEGVRPREAIRTIVIGWVNAREAARALAEAMPLLRLATSTHLVSVDKADRDFKHMPTISDVAAHLDRHGVAVSVDLISEAPRDAAAAILEQARRFSADLIVTGAYGHSRFREWILGGATRDLIAQSNMPLLMAH